MSAIPVIRYMFSPDEIIAAVLPNIGRAREIELRVDVDGYVVIDIIKPEGDASEQQPAKEKFDQPPEQPPVRDEQPAKMGPAEQEARRLCGEQLFRVFLEVKTEEAAAKVLAERSHVKQLSELDRTRSTALNLQYVVEEFEAWKIT